MVSNKWIRYSPMAMRKKICPRKKSMADGYSICDEMKHLSKRSLRCAMTHRTRTKYGLVLSHFYLHQKTLTEGVPPFAQRVIRRGRQIRKTNGEKKIYLRSGSWDLVQTMNPIVYSPEIRRVDQSWGDLHVYITNRDRKGCSVLVRDFNCYCGNNVDHWLMFTDR